MLSAALAHPSTTIELEALRAREFGRLDAAGVAYLDATGSALYGTSQVEAQYALLRDGVFGNPHSDSPPSRASTDAIDEARALVLRFFDVDPSTHLVIFTANATAAIKLVAESFPFTPERGLVLTADNHNSMNGIRELTRRAGATVRMIPLDTDLRLVDARRILSEQAPRAGLFGFPAQSNFSGVLHDLAFVDDARTLGFMVLLDAAAYAPTHALSLRRVPADFTAISFYKLFGLPTGLGALIARRESLARLQRPWFAGGTVLYASVLADAHRLRSGHEGFEDGTANFLGIASLASGFALLDRIGMDAVATHTRNLARALRDSLQALRHRNGTPLVRLYGPADDDTRDDLANIVVFNVCDRSGTPIEYARVEARCREEGVAVRGGCFCNPGASEAAFGIGADRLASCLDALGETFTPERLSACSGTAVGAIRASTGIATNGADILRLVDVVRKFQDS